jgi:hypothetical protein
MKAFIALQTRHSFLVGAVAVIWGITGCGGSDDHNAPTSVPCPAVDYPLITVDVVDAATGQPVDDATGIIVHTDGTTLPLDRDPTIAGQLTGGFVNKTGNWTVTVRAAGYSDWSVDGVVAPFSTIEHPCPRTHQLRASLIRP